MGTGPRGITIQRASASSVHNVNNELVTNTRISQGILGFLKLNDNPLLREEKVNSRALISISGGPFFGTDIVEVQVQQCFK